jgi:hypothetical protein
MFIKESLKIKIPSGRHLKSWQNKLNDINLSGGEEIEVHWLILKTSTHRTKFIPVRCDICNIDFERRIRDINDNYHLCPSCRKVGDRNPHYGKPINSALKTACKNLINERGNPFTWPESIEKIKNNPNFKNKGLKIRGIKRSEETRKKMSDGVKKAYESGKIKPGNGWSNVKIEKYKDIEYQGSYELRFLYFIESLNKLHIVERGPIITYSFEGDTHNYFIDYRIKNTNITFEIKSSYFWKKSLDINLAKKKAAKMQYNYHLILDNNFKEIEKIIINL